MSIELTFGAGTEVVYGKPQITALSKGRSGWPRIEIAQTITVKAIVSVGISEDDACGFCGKMPPSPDDNAAEFILRNHDGERIVFPCAEDTREERDSYPVTGWRSITLGDMEALACHECQEKLKESAKKLRKQR